MPNAKPATRAGFRVSRLLFLCQFGKKMLFVGNKKSKKNLFTISIISHPPPLSKKAETREDGEYHILKTYKAR
jgi:hypothetical protein